MATQSVSYTSAGTKASLTLDFTLDPFNVTVACTFAVGSTGTYSLQYSLDAISISDASATWLTSGDIPVGTTTNAVSLFTSAVTRIRLVIASISGTLTIQSLQSGSASGAQTSRLSTNMLQLSPASGLDGSEWLWLVQGGSDKRAQVEDIVDAAAGIPSGVEFVVLAPNTFLSQARTLAGTSGIVVLTDNGAGSTVVISLNAAGVAQLITQPRDIIVAGNVIVANDDVAIYMKQTAPQAVDIELPFASDKIGPVFVADVNGVSSSFNFRLVPAGGETINGLTEYFLNNNYMSLNLRPVVGVGYTL